MKPKAGQVWESLDGRLWDTRIITEVEDRPHGYMVYYSRFGSTVRRQEIDVAWKEWAKGAKVVIDA
jgi:hypothetical protein